MPTRNFLQQAADGHIWNKGDADFAHALSLYLDAKDRGLVIGSEYRSQEGPEDEILSFSVDRLTPLGEAERNRQ